MVNVFIVGSKGIPAKYGGFETFVDNLVRRKLSNNIKYFVSCMGNEGIYDYCGATCFSIPLEKDTAFGRIINVSNALRWVEDYLTFHTDERNNIVYILGCRVGLFISKHRKKLKSLGCCILTNPDGLEWKRDKWNWWQKKVLFASEKKLIRNSDYVICDSIGIKEYIKDRYSLPETKTKYIAYGSDVSLSTASDEQLMQWLNKYDILPHEYYLIIGRFVPENNYELIIKEFMNSNTTKKLLIITNVENNYFYKTLSSNLSFEKDNRIIFAGSLYDEQLVKKIRENAFCYIHGHSVGGTNPSLLEALASTKINLLFDVIFNKEVGEDQCMYFSNVTGDLSSKIDKIDKDYLLLTENINCKEIIVRRFSWQAIISQYEQCFVDVCALNRCNY